MIKISNKSIKKLAKIITGDSGISPRKSGPVLVEFFNEIGLDEKYEAGFPSRWKFTEDKIIEINGTDKILTLFEVFLDPRDFIDTGFEIIDVVSSVNEIIKFDELKVVEYDKKFKLTKTTGQIIESKSLEKLPGDLIQEQKEKCEKKIIAGDYDGAITNARTMVETVIIEILQWIDGKEVHYDGDLPKLYKTIQKKMNLEPQREDISSSLKQILSGMISVVNGLASIRNKMGDAHAKSYKPSEHHARFAVNSATTLSDFLVESFYYNKSVSKKLSDIQALQKEAAELSKKIIDMDEETFTL